MSKPPGKPPLSPRNVVSWRELAFDADDLLVTREMDVLRRAEEVAMAGTREVVEQTLGTLRFMREPREHPPGGLGRPAVVYHVFIPDSARRLADSNGFDLPPELSGAPRNQLHKKQMERCAEFGNRDLAQALLRALPDLGIGFEDTLAARVFAEVLAREVASRLEHTHEPDRS